MVSVSGVLKPPTLNALPHDILRLTPIRLLPPLNVNAAGGLIGQIQDFYRRPESTPFSDVRAGECAGEILPEGRAVNGQRAGRVYAVVRPRRDEHVSRAIYL